MIKFGIHIYTHEFFPTRGGIASYCHEFARAASAMGHAVQLHGPQRAKPHGIGKIYKVIPGRATGNHGVLALLKTRKLLKETLSQYPNDLHLLAEPGPIIAYGMLSQKYRANTHCFLTLHGTEINKWQHFSLQSIAARRALRAATAIRTVSTPINSLTEMAFPLLANKLRAVPNALPADYQSIAPPANTKKTTTRLKILSVGRIHPRKGYHEVLTALSKIPMSMKDAIQYTIAGAEKDRCYLNKLKQLASKHEITLHFQLNPSDSDLSKCYAQADVFTLTSVPYKNSVEGFGLVYLEAGAYGLPCLAYDIGGVKDAVRHNETGILIPSGDTDALAKAIQFLFKNPTDRIRLGKNNQHHATARTWADVVCETLTLAP